jgi:membrane fusion protein (multidrug efflux system)
MKFNFLAIAAALLLFASCAEKESVKQEAQQYKLLDITKESIALTNNYSASIRGRQDIKIVPRVDGHLTNIAITEGSKVKKGETLFIIDQVPYQAALQAAKASVAVFKASVATAKLTFESKQALYKKNIVSEFELISAKNALKTAQAQLLQAKAQETLAQNNLSYTVIKSPSDGVAGKLPYRKGDYVSPNTPDGLTVIADNSQMYVYFSMSERQIMDLVSQYGSMDSAIVKLPNIKLRLSNQTIYPQEGRIESISGIVDASTGAVSIRAAVPNEESILLSGSSGSVIMPHIQNNVIIIPQEATFEIQDKVYVYKVVDGVTVSTIVTVDKISDGKQYIVTSGLNEGETIIAEGAGLVQEGITVKKKA